MERICTENLHVNYCHVESQRQTRLQGAACHLFLEKNHFAKKLREFSTAFSGRNGCKQQVSVSQRVPLQSACAKFHQLLVRKKVGRGLQLSLS